MIETGTVLSPNASRASARSALRNKVVALDRRFRSPSIRYPHGGRYALGVDGHRRRRLGAMPDELNPRDKAREAIESGRLPTAKPSSIFCGPSSGETCAVCGVPIPPGHMQFLLEFPDSPSLRDKWLRNMLGRLRENSKVSRYRMHHHCFTAWEFERLTGAARRP